MSNEKMRQRRKQRIRKKVSGTDSRPRLVVFRSNKHIYAQIIEDQVGSACRALVSAKSPRQTAM